MSKTLRISDELYMELEESARERGLGSVESLLQEWQQEHRIAQNGQISPEELRSRRDLLGNIDALRAQIFATHGDLGDSVELIREDRARY